MASKIKKLKAKKKHRHKWSHNYCDCPYCGRDHMICDTCEEEKDI